MTTNKKSYDIIESRSFILPSDNDDMKRFIKKNKVLLTEQVISSIEYGIDNDLPFIEIFKFNGSDFVITVAEKDYLSNIKHIYNFYLGAEKYELCSRVLDLISKLERKQNNNEKEISLTEY